MDPALIKQREAFKKRAMAVPVVEKRSEPRLSSAAVKGQSKSRSRKKCKVDRPKPRKTVPDGVEQIRQSALLAHRSNPSRVLKAVIDMMSQRYCTKLYERLSLEAILEEIGLTELRTDTRQWLSEALRDNPKVDYSSQSESFLFKPALGMAVRSRRSLLAKLKECEQLGLGGVLMSDVREALPEPEKAVGRLLEDGAILKITRSDKEEVLFYLNKELSISVDEEQRVLWRAVAVDHLSEADVEKYLQNVGLGAMHGDSRRRKGPSQQQPASKRRKPRSQRLLNTHLDTTLLRDYSDTNQPPQ